MAQKKESEQWSIKKISGGQAEQQVTALRLVGAIPQETKTVDHINYIRIGDCLYIQVVYTDGTTTDIKICDVVPRPTFPA